VAVVVTLVGAVVVVFGLIGMAQPQRLMAWVKSAWLLDRLWLPVGIRLVLGAVLIHAAPDCRLPQAVRVIGVISIISAIVILLAGSQRVSAFADWWARQPPTFVRYWCLAATLFGGFLVFAGA
jgi:hypothetical protein